MKKPILLIILSLFFLGAIFIQQSIGLNNGKLTLVMCNVGQGDGILIRTPNGSDILIDGGPNDSILECLNKNMPFWDREIEVIILTHPHADHLAGLISVLESYSTLYFVTQNINVQTGVYKRFAKILDDKKITKKYLYAGEKIMLGDGVELDFLWPDKDWFDGQRITESTNYDLNGFSIINLLKYKDFSVALTGDIASEISDKIALNFGDIDVLKVSHHGSKTGLTDYFLNTLRPELALISVGAKNRYGHPNQQVLNLLNERKIKTLRTDLNREIKITTDGKTYDTNFYK